MSAGVALGPRTAEPFPILAAEVVRDPQMRKNEPKWSRNDGTGRLCARLASSFVHMLSGTWGPTF